MAWVAAAAPAVAGVIGNVAQQGERREALEMQREALRNIQNINTPQMNELRIILESYASAGQVAPQMQTIIEQGPTSMNDISTDPRLREARMNSLAGLIRQSRAGFTPQGEAAMGRIVRGIEQDAHSRDEAIKQDNQAHGGWNAGAEISSRLISSQGAANRAGQNSLDVGAQASNLALQSLASGGALAGQISDSDFREQAQIMQARDALKNWAAVNSQQVNNQNVAMRNAAQSQNLANNQNIANQNVGLRNQEEIYNKSLPQLDYQNKMGKATGQIPQSNQVSSSLNANAASTGAAIAGVGQNIGQGVAAVYEGNRNQEYLDYLKRKDGQPVEEKIS